MHVYQPNEVDIGKEITYHKLSRFDLAELQMKLGNFEKAERILKQTLQNEPGKLNIHTCE